MGRVGRVGRTAACGSLAWPLPQTEKGKAKHGESGTDLDDRIRTLESNQSGQWSANLLDLGVEDIRLLLRNVAETHGRVNAVANLRQRRLRNVYEIQPRFSRWSGKTFNDVDRDGKRGAP